MKLNFLHFMIAFAFFSMISTCGAYAQNIAAPHEHPVTINLRRGLSETKLKETFGILIERTFTLDAKKTARLYLLDRAGKPARLQVSDPDSVTSFNLSDAYNEKNPRVVIQICRKQVAMEEITLVDQLVVPAIAKDGSFPPPYKLSRIAFIEEIWTISDPEIVALIEKSLKAGVVTMKNVHEHIDRGEQAPEDKNYLYITYWTGEFDSNKKPKFITRCEVIGSDRNAEDFIGRTLEHWDYLSLKRERKSPVQ